MKNELGGLQELRGWGSQWNEQGNWGVKPQPPVNSNLYIYIYKPCTPMSSSTHSFQVFLFLPLPLTRVKIEPFFQGGSNFSAGGRILIFFPKIVKYWKLLCVKLLFSCKLSKTDPQPYFGTFPEGVDHCSRGSNPQPPVNFYPASHPCHLHLSTGWNPIIHTPTLQMPKPPQSALYGFLESG